MAKLGGILGGMGVDVTAELLTRIIDLTAADNEQGNIPLIIHHNPTIPDRTEAIVHDGEDPLPHLSTSLNQLVKAGVDFIAIPCNTAHYWYDPMQCTTSVPIIHMLREAVDKCLSIKNNVKSVGILATTGTVSSGLYQALFAEQGIRLLTPDDRLQKTVMTNIIAIKTRKKLPPIQQSMLAIARQLIQGGAEIILVGCTDISLVVHDGDLDVPVVDALSVLAEVVVRIAKEESAP